MGFKDAISTMTGLYELGEPLYNALLQTKPEGVDIIICPEHLGDTLWIAVFADAYKRQHSCSGVLFVVHESQKDMLSIFPSVDAVIGMKTDNMNALRFYIIVNQLWYRSGIRFAHFKCEVILNPDLLCNQFVNIIEKHDFMNVSRRSILELPKDCVKCGTIPPQAEPENYEKFRNSVLLLPAAQTQPGHINGTFWEKLAARIKQRGMSVYCNYNGLPYEVLVEGAEPLSTKLLELYHLSPVFHRCIGMRSGICDLLALAKVPLTVVHPRYDSIDEMIIPESAPLADHLYQLNQLDSLQTLQYRQEWEDALIEEILKKI